MKKLKGKLKYSLKTNENRNTTYKNLWDAAKRCSKREVHSKKCQHQARKCQINNQNLSFKELKKETELKSL